MNTNTMTYKIKLFAQHFESVIDTQRSNITSGLNMGLAGSFDFVAQSAQLAGVADFQLRRLRSIQADVAAGADPEHAIRSVHDKARNDLTSSSFAGYRDEAGSAEEGLRGLVRVLDSVLAAR